MGWFGGKGGLWRGMEGRKKVGEVKNWGVGRRVGVEDWGRGVFGESDGFRISCKGKSTE